MDIQDVASTRVAQDTSAKPQKPRTERTEKVEKQPVQDKGAVVEISTKSGEVVEKNNVTDNQGQKNAEVAEKKFTPPEGKEAPQGNAQRLDYSVEEGSLVVKVIDTDEGEVVKEIPAEDERRIRQAISKFAENAENKGDQDVAKEIDITS